MVLVDILEGMQLSEEDADAIRARMDAVLEDAHTQGQELDLEHGAKLWTACDALTSGDPLVLRPQTNTWNNTDPILDLRSLPQNRRIRSNATNSM